MKSRREVSAGGVVFRQQAGQSEVLIVQPEGYANRWMLPKGVVGQGETIEAAALREVREETGVTAEILQSLGAPEAYVYTARGVRVFKQVHYFLMRYQSGDPTPQRGEIQALQWLPIAQAIDTLTYAATKQLVERSRAILEAPTPMPPSE